MNWETIEGKWDQFKGQVKEKWGKLTDNDLKAIAGKKDQLAGKLKEKYGYAKEKIEQEVDSFCQSCDSKTDSDLQRLRRNRKEDSIN